jgi:hypothetical protein
MERRKKKSKNKKKERRGRYLIHLLWPFFSPFLSSQTRQGVARGGNERIGGWHHQHNKTRKQRRRRRSRRKKSKMVEE